MKVFCQSIFNNVLPPSVRSVITKELIEHYGFTQEEAAKKLNITQPAVSQYLNGLRGKQVDKITANKKIMEWIKGFAYDVASGNVKLNMTSCDVCGGKEAEDELKPLLCLLELEERGKHE